MRETGGSVESIVLQRLAAVSDVPVVGGSDLLRNVLTDSLKLLGLLERLQEELGVQVDVVTVLAAETASDLVGAVEAAVARG